MALLPQAGLGRSLWDILSGNTTLKGNSRASGSTGVTHDRDLLAESQSAWARSPSPLKESWEQGKGPEARMFLARKSFHVAGAW